jgi:uncharacterized membrane protein
VNKADQRGSVLMLVPAAVLVLLILGAIAVDSAVVFLAQRDLANRTAAAANDIAGASAEDTSFYRGGAITLDVDAGRRFVDATFAPARRPVGYTAWGADVRSVSDRTIDVAAWAEVKYVFAGAIPGMPDTTRVTAHSTASARGG